MYLNIWTFLTASVIFGSLFFMLLVFVIHKKTIKEMEIEALKIKSASFQAGDDNPLSNKLGANS